MFPELKFAVARTRLITLLLEVVEFPGGLILNEEPSPNLVFMRFPLIQSRRAVAFVEFPANNFTSPIVMEILPGTLGMGKL